MKPEKTSESFNLKLERAKQIENSEKPFFTPVQQILEPRVNAIASLDAMYRNIFRDQLAVAISKGDPFLDCFDTEKSRVLIMTRGNADTAITKDRINKIGNKPENIDVLKFDERIEPGERRNLDDDDHKLIESIIHKIKSDKFKVFFLGDFDDIQTKLYRYIEHETKSKKDKVDIIDPRYEQFNYERGRRNIRKLRDICTAYDVSIMIGHDLTQKGKLKHINGIFYCDGKLLLTNVGDDWKLKTDGHDIVGKQSFNLVYDSVNNFYLSDEEFKNMTNLGLIDNDMKVIDAMWGKGPMRRIDIEEATGLAHATVGQRLKYLQKRSKGSWVVKSGDKYRVDQNKDRPWIR